MSFKSKALVVGFAAVFTLSACATGYGTNFLGLGLKTEQFSDNVHKVSYQGNGYTSEQVPIIQSVMTLKEALQIAHTLPSAVTRPWAVSMDLPVLTK